MENLAERDALGAAALKYLDSGGKRVKIRLLSDVPKAQAEEIDVGAEFFQDPKDFDTEYKNLLRHAEGRTLDIGCGPGKFLLYLQGLGFEVVGIDKWPLVCQACRWRGAKDVREMDALKLHSSIVGRFKTILLLGSNLGIGGDPRGVRSLLARIHELTTDEGFVLLDSIDKEKVLENRSEQETAYSKAVGRYKGQICYRLVFDQYDTGFFDWIHVPPNELKEWAEPIGWRLTNVSSRKPGYWTGVLRK